MFLPCSLPEMSCFVMVRSPLVTRSPSRGDNRGPGREAILSTAAGPLPSSPASGRGDFECPSVSRIPFLHRVSFPSLSFVPSPTCPASGTLVSRVSRAGGRPLAPARFARLIAPARAWARTQGADLPSVSQGFFRAGAKRKAKQTRGCRFAFLPPHLGAGLPGVKL